MKTLVPILLGVVFICSSATSVFADPWYGVSSVAVGDECSITTVHGFAQAWVDGRLVTTSASLQMQVQVTSIGPYNVAFRILSGTFQVGDRAYQVDVGGWRGFYNLLTHTSVYQGPATAPNGGVGYFVLYGQDASLSNGGIIINIYSDFRGEYGALWHVKLTAVRY